MIDEFDNIMFVTKFNNDIQNIWIKYSKEVNGFHELGKHTLYGRISYNYYPWELILDSHTVRFPKDDNSRDFTRLRAPFANADAFTCEIYKSSFSSEIAKAFGMQDIRIGNELFDSEYIVKSSSENRIRMLLDDRYVQKKIMELDNIHLKVGSANRETFLTHPYEVDELYIEVGEILSNINQLRFFTKFGIYLLNRLCNTDSICSKHI